MIKCRLSFRKPSKREMQFVRLDRAAMPRAVAAVPTNCTVHREYRPAMLTPLHGTPVLQYLIYGLTQSTRVYLPNDATADQERVRPPPGEIREPDATAVSKGVPFRFRELPPATKRKKDREMRPTDCADLRQNALGVSPDSRAPVSRLNHHPRILSRRTLYVAALMRPDTEARCQRTTAV